jgi:ABC-type branched-subunit amino acid transport system permease subunit
MTIQVSDFRRHISTFPDCCLIAFFGGASFVLAMSMLSNATLLFMLFLVAPLVLSIYLLALLYSIALGFYRLDLWLLLFFISTLVFGLMFYFSVSSHDLAINDAGNINSKDYRSVAILFSYSFIDFYLLWSIFRAVDPSKKSPQDS